MTDLLEQAIARIRERPTAEQNQMAEVILHMLDVKEDLASGDVALTTEQIEKVTRTIAGLEDGTVQIATDVETTAMWRRFGL